MMEWQPIETAPQGVMIVGMNKFQRRCGIGCMRGALFILFDWDGNEIGFRFPPTYWAPIPDPKTA